MLRTQAPGTDGYSLLLAIGDNCGSPEVRRPATLGMTVGVRYTVSKLRSLTTNLALQVLLLFD